MPRGNQLARQWQLLQMIQSPAGIAVEDAARKLDCAVRTIWRDLRVLEQAGFPLYDDKSGDGRRSIWKLEEKFTLGLPVKLTLAETAALLMSRELLCPAGAQALGTAVTSAFDKIGRVLSWDARQLLEQMRESIGVRAVGGKLQAPAAEHMAHIERALAEHRRLDMRYYSMSRDDDLMEMIRAAIRELHDGGQTHVAVLGFCMGGGLAFRAALRQDGLTGAVMFYATPRGRFEHLSVPVLGHFALVDRFVSVDAVRVAEAELRRTGKAVTFHYYEAEHSFMNEKLPAFSRAAAELAWGRTLDFLGRVSR